MLTALSGIPSIKQPRVMPTKLRVRGRCFTGGKVRRKEWRIRARGDRYSNDDVSSLEALESVLSTSGECGALDPRGLSLPLSGAAMGLALGAASFHIASLGVASLVLSAIVFIPTLRSAVLRLKNDYRVDNDVLTASRLIVFVALNFYVVAALDALLRSVAGRLHWNSKVRYDRRIRRFVATATEQGIADASPIQRRVLASSEAMRLAEVALEKGQMDLKAARAADKMAPYMMGAFLFSLPVYGANLAASFLMTSFGAHLRTLSPTTLREVLSRAIDQGVVVRNTEVLAAMTKRPALVVDIDMVSDSNVLSTLASWAATGEDAIESAPHGRFESVYFLATEADVKERSLLCELAGASLLVAHSEESKQRHLDAVIGECHKVVYVGDCAGEPTLCSPNLLLVARVAHPQATFADVLVVSDLIAGLETLHEASERYDMQGRSNWRFPVLCDCLDISTTVFIHFGVFYSALFNYTGLITEILAAKRDKRSAVDQPVSRRAPLPATVTLQTVSES